jgi:preprotein translocase subunit SecA
LVGLEKLATIGEGRKRKRLEEYVRLVNSFESELEELTDGELQAKTDEFRKRLEDGETFDDLIPEAFAVVREAAKRTIGQRHLTSRSWAGWSSTRATSPR